MTTAEQPGEQQNQPVSGPGDLIRKMTSAAGIQPCTRCTERADWLNGMWEALRRRDTHRTP